MITGSFLPEANLLFPGISINNIYFILYNNCNVHKDSSAQIFGPANIRGHTRPFASERAPCKYRRA